MQGTQLGTKGWNDQSALSISANGSTTGTGILWASMPLSGISNPGPVPGILYALDATNLTTVLWSSQLDAGRDAVGNYAKFVPPTVVNGKVYLATFSGQLVVYGIVGPPDFSVTAAPSSQSVTAGSPASYSVYVNPQGAFTGTVTLTCSGLPSGASCSPASISVPSGSGQVSTQLVVNTTAGGSSTFTITATDGSLVHTTSATPDGDRVRTGGCAAVARDHRAGRFGHFHGHPHAFGWLQLNREPHLRYHSVHSCASEVQPQSHNSDGCERDLDADVEHGSIDGVCPAERTRQHVLRHAAAVVRTDAGRSGLQVAEQETAALAGRLSDAVMPGLARGLW